MESYLGDKAPTKLVVEVVGAHNLMPQPKGPASVCVDISVDDERHRTAIKEYDLHPVWNELLYFGLWQPSKLRELDIQAHVYLVDSSSNGSRTFRGMVRIAGASWGPITDAVVIHYPLEWFEIFSCVKGELSLKIYTIDEPPIRPSKLSPPMDRVVYTNNDSYIRIANTSPQKDKAVSSPDLHVSNNLESILQNQSSRPQDVPLQHLKEITNNFSDERILGQGGFGVVYKGVLQNGKMIAVKKIVSSLMPGLQKQFENDVYHLMMLKHPNIVRCVGYCYETRNACLEYNGEYVFAEMAERLLCLEYLPKGSLDKYLSDESSGFDWSTRYKIIEGICYGLCHLHEQIDNPIIHCDLKPANILLDDSLVPKITDFGLSRLLGQQQTICTSSRVGTFGYMAPEFLHGGTITPKSDIFSLGVVIMEIITGHRDYPGVTGTSSDEFIELALKNWRNVLQRSTGYGSLEIYCKQIKRCIQVGLICVNPDRTKRPAMTKVVNMIQGLESIGSNEATTQSARVV